MNNFNELLVNIRKRPTMYLNWYSIFAFQSFYNGYCIARTMDKLPMTSQQQEFEDFLTWIETDYAQLYMTTNRTWSVIVFIICPDEKKALDLLFELYRQHLEKKNNSKTKNQN